jgi:hypothetical protein
VGSATGAQWTWTRALRNRDGIRGAGVVRGHWLNHDLGGEAILANLYPISTKANSHHSADVEQPAKQLMHDAEKKIRAANDGRLVDDPNYYVYYDVTVAETIDHDPVSARFDCSFGIGGYGKHKTIHSHLKLDRDKYVAAAGLQPGKPKVAPLAAWAHGTRRHNDNVSEAVSAGRATIDNAAITDAAGNVVAAPERVSGAEPNYTFLFNNLFITNKDFGDQTVQDTASATYRYTQDAVRKYLLSRQVFRDDLEDFSVQKIDAKAFLPMLKSAMAAAANAVPAEDLPAKAQKPAFKLKKWCEQDPVLKELYEQLHKSSPQRLDPAKKSLKANALAQLKREGIVSSDGTLYTLPIRI